MAGPEIKPIKVIDYKVKQSKYEHCPRLPCRMAALGPSGSGKTVTLANLILNVYRGCWDRIYIYSPSVHLDQTWAPVKQHIEEDLGVNPKKEPFCFDEYDPEAMQAQIEQQAKVIEFMKEKGHKKLFQVLFIIDDFADSPEFTRNSKILHQLYIRGRHIMASTITATQVYKAISPVIRKNLTHLLVWRLRNQADLDAWIDELSAVYDKKTLLKLYKTATDIPYNFLYINLVASEKKDMFFSGFTHRLVPKG